MKLSAADARLEDDTNRSLAAPAGGSKEGKKAGEKVGEEEGDGERREKGEKGEGEVGEKKVTHKKAKHKRLFSAKPKGSSHGGGGGKVRKTEEGAAPGGGKGREEEEEEMEDVEEEEEEVEEENQAETKKEKDKEKDTDKEKEKEKDKDKESLARKQWLGVRMRNNGKWVSEMKRRGRLVVLGEFDQVALHFPCTDALCVCMYVYVCIAHGSIFGEVDIYGFFHLSQRPLSCQHRPSLPSIH